MTCPSRLPRRRPEIARGASAGGAVGRDDHARSPATHAASASRPADESHASWSSRRSGRSIVRRQRRERVLGVLRNDHVAEHEPPAGPQGAARRAGTGRASRHRRGGGRRARRRRGRTAPPAEDPRAGTRQLGLGKRGPRARSSMPGLSSMPTTRAPGCRASTRRAVSPVPMPSSRIVRARRPRSRRRAAPGAPRSRGISARITSRYVSGSKCEAGPRRRPYPRLRSPGDPPRLRLPARHRPGRRAAVHLRGAGRRGEGRRRRGALRERAPARRRHRGGRGPPEGVDAAPVERVAETLPPALVDLALWLADYYGSTPARALSLVAPHNAEAPRRAAAGRRRAARSPRRRRRSGSPSRRSGRSPGSRSCSRAAAATCCSRARPAAARRRSTSAPARRRSPRAAARSCSSPRSRSRRRRSAASAPASAIASRCSTRRSPRPSGATSASGSPRGEAPVVVGARSAVFAPRARRSASICVDEEHDAVVQAGVRPALRRAHRRGEAGRARGRRRRLRLGDAAAGVVGSGSSGSSSAAGSRAPMPTGARRRPPPRGRLPALGAAARRAGRARRTRRQGDPAPQPARAWRPRSTAAPAAPRAAAATATSP